MRRLAAWLVAAISLIVLFGACGCEASHGEDIAQGESAVEQPAAPLPRLIHPAAGGEMMEVQLNQIPGLTVTAVKSVELPGVLETTGQISFEDRRVSAIISRVSGRIEQTRVSQWDYVRRGQPILTLYSPDYMTAEAEYLQARATAGMHIGGPQSDTDNLSATMLEAARRKLELLGMEPEQIAQIKAATPSFTLRAPISGTIVDNKAVRGAQVNPGDTLYSLGTLDEVWITADLYESDVARVHVGQQIEATATSFPGEVFRGTVDRISPNVDPNTHTIQLRGRIRNTSGKLKPQMLAKVKIVTQPGAALVVPQAALVFDVDAYFAFVVTGPNLVERRKVTIGSWNEQGFARVLGGIKAGERVVDKESIQVDAMWHMAHGESS